MRILILGGYGVFGGRLAELLADRPDLELLICGRDLARAEAFCTRYQGEARAFPGALNRRDIADALQRFTPGLVVDASGPFQDYGTDRYHVVDACIAAGVDYLDFADGADFVFGIGLYSAEGVNCYGTNTHLEDFTPGQIHGEGEVTFAIDALDLVEGTYKLDVAVHKLDGYPYDYHRLLYTFRVKSRSKEVGIYRPAHRWQFTPNIRLLKD